MNPEREKFSNVPIVWNPKPDVRSQMRAFMDLIRKKYGVNIGDYWDLHRWSVTHIPEFWAEIWDHSGILHSDKYQKVIDLSIPMSESPEWFDGAKLNYAENLLKYRDDRVALILAGEDTASTRLTYAQLYEETKLYAAALRKFGLKKEDVVMCYMSNRKEAIVAMLATVSIGALWTGALPQLGHKAVLNRVSQVNPKVLFTLDRFSFNNEEIAMLPNVKRITEGLPSLEKVVIVPSKENCNVKEVQEIRNSCILKEFLNSGKEKDGSVPEIQFEQVSMSHPIFINFTSGTTGIPKAIVHGSGVLLCLYKDFKLHLDVKRDDVLLSMSPVGWVSWNWFTTLLSLGCGVLLYEGCPYYRSPTTLWDMIDEFGISHLMITPANLDEVEKRRYLPTRDHRLTSLRVLMCGGSVVKPISYDFVYNELKLDVLFASIYGCSEMMTMCTTIDFTLPVHRGESPAPSLATLVESCDETTGQPLKGEIGELVVSTHTPGLVLKLIGDEDGTLFREKYFGKYSGKFLMGDHGIINPATKGFIICGRSDATLKQRGCRFGSSEIYNVVDQFDEVKDSVCVSQYNKEGDERAVLFLQMKEGHPLDDILVSKIRRRIEEELTPRHVPDIILETQEIPCNTNGKKMEITVKKIINNKPYSIDAIANPESVKYYLNRTELRDYWGKSSLF